MSKRGEPKKTGAGNETRTRDTKLGKLVLYQLSYARPPRKKLLRQKQLNVNIFKYKSGLGPPRAQHRAA